MASCSPAAIRSSTAVGQLGVRLDLVRLERLLEPVDAELLELPGHGDRLLRVGAVGEPGVDHDRDAVTGRLTRGGCERDVVRRDSDPAAPSRA